MDEPKAQEKERRKGAQVHRRTLSSRGSYTSAGRRGEIRPSRRRRRKKIIFWGLLVGLAAVLGGTYWIVRRSGVEPRDDKEFELRTWEQRREPLRR